MSQAPSTPGVLPLTGLDTSFARYLNSVVPSSDPRHSLLAALTSHQFGRGHACLDLELLQKDGPRALGWDEHTDTLLPPDIQLAANSLPWIGRPGPDGYVDAHSPLVLDGQRLYLRRNWIAEQSILSAIATRLAQPCPVPENLSESLARLFETPTTPSSEPDWQQVACALAARRRFTLITGGPGTGKTTTVVRLLALLQSDPDRQRTPLRIALAAPTGKAAARLGESISSAIKKLPVSMQQHIPDQAVTLHKLLQVRSHQADAGVPKLAVDLVVVDEASMIDLEMMARLLAAVPLNASLILLGDKDQLASVEAGAVMGQLCAGAEGGHYNRDTLAWVARTTGADLSLWAGQGSALAQQTVMLRLSRRFSDDSAIGQWAKAVNAGDVTEVQALWRKSPEWQQSAPANAVNRLRPTQTGDSRLSALIQHGWQAWLQMLKTRTSTPCIDAHALLALKAFAQFQVLCAVREGPWGVDTLNPRLATSLGFPSEGWYAGRPVMVTRNDYNLKLMNGDVGLCLPHTNGLRVAFPDGQGGIRWVLPSRLDAVESVFALTVHKSQGSEYEHVCLVLPDRAVVVFTRELLYTGITRAKTRLTLAIPQSNVLFRAVQARVIRSGGLEETDNTGNIDQPDMR